MLRIEDFSEIGYGGAVTLAEWWDQKRIDEAKLKKSEVFKKAATYVYGLVGIGATLASAFNWLPGQRLIVEKVSTGFMYDLPRNLMGMVQSMSKSSAGARADAVKEAQRIVSESRRAALNPGRNAARSYQHEFEMVDQI